MSTEQALLQTIKELGHDTSVFKSRWIGGQCLDKNILISVPMFWYQKCNWQRDEIEKLFKDAQIALSSKIQCEMDYVFGHKKRNKKKKRRKRCKTPYSSSPDVAKHEVNQTDLYTRKRKSLKKVKKKQTKAAKKDEPPSNTDTQIGEISDIESIADETTDNNDIYPLSELQSVDIATTFGEPEHEYNDNMDEIEEDEEDKITKEVVESTEEGKEREEIEDYSWLYINPKHRRTSSFIF